MRFLKQSKIVVGLGKTAFAGGVIFAIGMGMLVLQPEPEEPVAYADADIFGFEFGPQSQQQKFVQALMQEGMEEPRAYDVNGNKMFFSTTVTKESPREVLERFQRAFVEVGLNEHMHTTQLPMGSPEIVDWDAIAKDPKRHKQTQAFFEQRKAWGDDYVGGVVPRLVEDHRVMMMGMTSLDEAETGLDWAMEAVEQAQKSHGDKIDLSEGIKAMRYMDAVRERDGRTRINAVWSDEEFAMRKIADIGENVSVDPRIPICPGCSRLLNFNGETEKEYSNTAIDGGHQTIDQVLTFYERAFTNRGWEMSPTTAVLREAERLKIKPPGEGPEILEFQRGDESITVMAFPDELGRTGVQVARAPASAAQ